MSVLTVSVSFIIYFYNVYKRKKVNNSAVKDQNQLGAKYIDFSTVIQKYRSTQIIRVKSMML